MRPIVIRIGIEDNGKTMEVVGRAEDIAELVAVTHVPEGESVAEQVLAVTVHRELELDLPVGHVNRLFFIQTHLEKV